jgi:hypothetical protein
MFIEPKSKPQPQPSAQQSGSWSELEMTLAHAIGIRCVRQGPRTTDIAAALAIYRERIIGRLRNVQDPDDLHEAIRCIRSGELA